MIISASYKTDIPVFYDEWFMNRPRAGFCKMVTPYNQRAIRVDLIRSQVVGINGYPRILFAPSPAREDAEKNLH